MSAGQANPFGKTCGMCRCSHALECAAKMAAGGACAAPQESGWSSPVRSDKNLNRKMKLC